MYECRDHMNTVRPVVIQMMTFFYVSSFGHIASFLIGTQYFIIWLCCNLTNFLFYTCECYFQFFIITNYSECVFLYLFLSVEVFL